MNPSLPDYTQILHPDDCKRCRQLMRLLDSERFSGLTHCSHGDWEVDVFHKNPKGWRTYRGSDWQTAVESAVNGLALEAQEKGNA